MLLNNGCDHFQKSVEKIFSFMPPSPFIQKKNTAHIVFLVYSVPLLFGVYPTQAVDLLCTGMFCVGSSADSLCNASLHFPAVGFDRELHRWRSFWLTLDWYISQMHVGFAFSGTAVYWPSLTFKLYVKCAAPVDFPLCVWQCIFYMLYGFIIRLAVFLFLFGFVGNVSVSCAVLKMLECSVQVWCVCVSGFLIDMHSASRCDLVSRSRVLTIRRFTIYLFIFTHCMNEIYFDSY